MRTHYYVPAHVTKHSRGNVKACCDRPESEHPTFVDGTTVTIRLTRQIRSLKNNVFPKGTVFVAERDVSEGYHEVSPSRWGTNVLGQFAEIERSVWFKVPMPGYTITVDGCLTGIPVNYAEEVTK